MKKSLEPARLGKRVFLAWLLLLALRVRYEVGGGLETGNALIDNLSKIPNQISACGMQDLLMLAALTFLLREAEGRCDRWALALAAVFSALYTVSMVCRECGRFTFFLANGYQLCLTLFLLAAHTLLFYCMLRIFFRLLESPLPPGGDALRYPLLRTAGLIFLGWLPWLLMNYPCSFNGDSILQLEWALGLSAWSAHHPPLGTAVLTVFVRLGRALGSVNFGCFLYVLFQSVTGAFVFAACVRVLGQMGLPRRLCRAAVLLFALSPFWGCFAQWLEKDFLYAQAFTLTLLLLLPALRERQCSRKRAALLGLTALTALLLRKTGLYEIIPGLLLALPAMQRGTRRRLFCAAAAAVLLASCVNNLLYPALGIEPASPREAFNIPFQQTARYVNQFPEEVTEEEREAIDAVLVYDELKLYDPIISDPVKNNYRENNTALPRYFRHWFSMFLKHPVCYLEAGAMICYGYIAPTVVGLDAYIQSSYFPVAEKLGAYRVFGDFPTRLFDSLRQMFIEFPVTGILGMAGFYTWLLLACAVQLLRRKRYRLLPLFVPGIMNVLVCIASPTYCSTRYELPTIAAVTLFLGVTFLSSREKTQRS